MSLVRTRWAAVGAALAITLGAAGIGMVSATVSSGERTVLVPITSCRVADTRPGTDNVGPKASPLGPGEVHTISTHGNNGKCTGIPSDAVALSLNVTALNATQLTFLTIWATGVTQPVASSLNPSSGQPPVPNAVTTGLSPSGQFNIFNESGRVDVIVDIVGYYADHNHDDSYYTKAQVENLVFTGTIPSGVTVTGNVSWDSHGSSSTATNFVPVEFPGRAPVPLTANEVNFDQPGTTGDGDPLCGGTTVAPTAPAGKVCIYLVEFGGMAANTLEGEVGYPLDDAGFRVYFVPNGTDNVDQYFYASWAYTAP